MLRHDAPRLILVLFLAWTSWSRFWDHLIRRCKCIIFLHSKQACQSGNSANHPKDALQLTTSHTELGEKHFQNTGYLWPSWWAHFPANGMATVWRQSSFQTDCSGLLCLKILKPKRVKEETQDLPRKFANFHTRNGTLQMTTLNGTGMETAAAKGKISSTILLTGFSFWKHQGNRLFMIEIVLWEDLANLKNLNQKGPNRSGALQLITSYKELNGELNGKQLRAEGGTSLTFRSARFPANPMGTLSRQFRFEIGCDFGCASEELLKSSKQTRIKEEAYDLPRNSANFCNRSDALQMTSSHNELRGKQLGTSSTFWMGAPRSNQSPAFQICWNWHLRKLQCQRNKRIAFDFHFLLVVFPRAQNTTTPKRNCHCQIGGNGQRRL